MTKSNVTGASAATGLALSMALCVSLSATAPAAAQGQPRPVNPAAYETVELSVAKTRGSGGPAARFIFSAALLALVLVGASK